MTNGSSTRLIRSPSFLTRSSCLLLLSAALLGCGQQAPTATLLPEAGLQLEAEEGSIEAALTLQVVSDPIGGGRIINDQAASGGRAVILLGTNDAVRFKLPGSFTAGRYTVKVRGRGEAYQGWPTVALENVARRRIGTTTLDTASYGVRTFGEYDLKAGQELFFTFTNDLYGGPGKDRNAVMDYLIIEPVSTQPTGYAIQFGTNEDDFALSLSVDASDNTYVAGSGRAFLRKTNAQGQEVWTRRIETVNPTGIHATAVDAGGNVYAGGYTWDTLPGQSNGGRFDAFVRKYSSDGSELWTRQFGLAGGDVVRGLELDGSGNVYLVGTTDQTLPGQTSAGGTDAFLRKYTPDGAEVWTRQFGTGREDNATGIAVDTGGNVSVVGTVADAYPGPTSAEGSDVFVRRFTSSGTPVWSREFGTVGTTPTLDDLVYNRPLNTDSGQSVGVDRAGNVYISGSVRGTLPGQTSAGAADAFVRKYSPDGSELWTRQSGTADNDGGVLGIDGAGNVYLARTSIVPGPGRDGTAVLLRYAPDGTLVQSRPVAATSANVSDVAAGASGNVFLTGSTSGAVEGRTNLGGTDAFLIKLVP